MDRLNEEERNIDEGKEEKTWKDVRKKKKWMRRKKKGKPKSESEPIQDRQTPCPIDIRGLFRLLFQMECLRIILVAYRNGVEEVVAIWADKLASLDLKPSLHARYGDQHTLTFRDDSENGEGRRRGIGPCSNVRLAISWLDDEMRFSLVFSLKAPFMRSPT